MPIHRQPCNPELENSNAPNSNLIYETGFTLPIFNDMTEDECNLVIDYCNKL
jgi:dTDP-4-amino-4,6-dideoxygalactose transaminase